MALKAAALVGGSDCVAQGHAPAGAANSRHLGQGLRRILEMMKREAAGHDIKCLIRERQRVHVAGPPFHIGEVSFRGQGARLIQHGLRHIEAIGAARMRRESRHDRAGSARNVQRLVRRLRLRGVHEQHHLSVAVKLGRSRKQLSLPAELVADQRLMG
ncbi:MAG TPA: hypothetical protein VG291_18950 [Xanthobacteraceae bacterium]|nr:hypothetical protein [Xanthobacteraceae bacterium]